MIGIYVYSSKAFLLVGNECDHQGTGKEEARRRIDWRDRRSLTIETLICIERVYLCLPSSSPQSAFARYRDTQGSNTW